MFKGNNNMQGMLKQVQKMQQELEKTQSQLGNLTISEEVGGGMVKVTVNGNKEVVALTIDPQVINPEEKEMLEDLIIAAVNKGIETATKMADAELSKVSKNFLPPGMNLPGF